MPGLPSSLSVYDILDWLIVGLLALLLMVLLLKPAAVFTIALAVATLTTTAVRQILIHRSQSFDSLLQRFPEVNPNPILRLSLQGQIDYANRGCSKYLKTLGLPEDPKNLLPADFADRFNRFKQSDKLHQTWEYRLKDHYLICEIFRLDEGFYLYIADISGHKRIEQELAWHAYHDDVTGLPNRYRFQHDLELCLDHQQPGQRCAIMLLNIDRFKLFVGTLGYLLGDRFLQAVAARLKSTLKQEPKDVRAKLYRFEADTFALLLTHYNDQELPQKLANKLALSLQAPIYVDHREFCVSLSIGISLYPSDGADYLHLVRSADLALQHAKKRGGGTWLLHNPAMEQKTKNWLSLEGYLRHAIEHNELELYYQPQVKLADARLCGAEITLRWQHPQKPLLHPKDFIPLAEETGLIAPISEWILRQTLIQHRNWQARGLPPIRLAVNISAHQFHRQDLPQLIERLLRETQVESRYLELEVTETAAMLDIEHTVVVLQQLKGLGVQLALDDFGTGFSSLSYLRRFPIDALKIDQSFIHPMDRDKDAAAIVKGVISLGHSLRLRVLAEGIETHSQLEALRQFECDEGQGYLFSKPVSAKQFEAILGKGRLLV